MNSLKATIIYASPRRNGNSATLARKVRDGISSAGGTAEEFYLHGTTMAPCSACDSCQSNEEYRCVVIDDLTPVLKSAADCDYLILAGPVYNFNVSAQLKIFLDRSYSLWKPKGSVLEGTKVVLILTYADEDAETSGVFNAITSLKDGYRFVEADVIKVLHYTAGDAGEIAQNAEAMQEAFATGVAIGSGTV